MKSNVIDNVRIYYANSDYNPFNKNSGAYYITRQTAEDIFEDNKKKEVQKEKALGLIISNIALVSALGGYALFKGLPGGTYKHLSKLGLKLEEKIGIGSDSSMLQFYNALLKGTRGAIERTRSVNNFTSFKDLLFKNIMSKTKITTKIHDGITNLFEKMSKRTVNHRYSIFDNAISNFFMSLDKINEGIPKRMVTINGVTKSSAEWIEETKRLRLSMAEKVKLNFGQGARDARYTQMKAACEGLDDRVLAKSLEGLSKDAKLNENMQALKDSDIAQTFIAEDLLASDKLKLRRSVGAMRSQITRNIDDNYKEVKDLLDNISKCLEPIDKKSHNAVKVVKEHLLRYKKLSGPKEGQFREQVNNELLESLRILSDTVKTSDMKYDPKTIENIVETIKSMESVLTTGKKGDMQELLTIYKELLSKSEYKKLRTQSESVTGTFDRAIKTETDDFFDKLRDLKLGSAPTDVMSILISLGSVGLALGLADNKDERTSATVKYAIPAVGGIATALVLTSNLVSGFTGMGLGLLSSLLLNEIGDGVDKFRKNVIKHEEYLKQQEELNKKEKVAVQDEKPHETKAELEVTA